MLVRLGMEGKGTRSTFASTPSARLVEPSIDAPEESFDAAPKTIVTHSPMKFDKLPMAYQLAKRCLDVLVSAGVLLLLLPLLVLVAILIKVTSKGPIIYRSRRVGKNGKEFWFYKFRTMYTGAEALNAQLANQNQHTGPIFKIKSDPRITPIGKFLRKYSIDEMPQLLHVLLGDMTLVGPRPHLPTEVKHYDEKAAQRLLITPGLTCYWQIMGRSDLAYDEWDRRRQLERGPTRRRNGSCSGSHAVRRGLVQWLAGGWPELGLACRQRQ